MSYFVTSHSLQGSWFGRKKKHLELRVGANSLTIVVIAKTREIFIFIGERERERVKATRQRGRSDYSIRHPLAREKLINVHGKKQRGDRGRGHRKDISYGM